MANKRYKPEEIVTKLQIRSTCISSSILISQASA
jgi:hypothetical protein